jgi:hypothetical protein
MHDFVEDGNAIPLEEATKKGAEVARGRRLEIGKEHLNDWLKSGEAWEVKDLNRDRRAQGLPPVRGNFQLGGVRYEVLPEALARLRIKQRRVTPTQSIPADYRDWRTLTVGGKRYLVEPRAAMLAERALGMSKKQFTDAFGMDRYGKIAQTERALWSAWMGFRNATIPVKLSMSAFHANHILQIFASEPVAAATTHLLNRRMSITDYIKALKDQYANVEAAYGYGRYLAMNFTKPDSELSPLERAEQNLLLAGGFAPQRPSIYEVRATEELRRTMDDVIPSILQKAEAENWSTLAKGWKVTPQYAKAAALGIGRISEALQGPLFNDYIPAIKAASYLNEAKLLLSARPDLLESTPEANAMLRDELHKIAKSIDNRFGEMQYDKLFMDSLWKRAMFGTFLSVGWNLGFLREFGQGLTSDVVKTFRTGEISARTVYASTYIILTTAMAGLMTYIFTGKPPSEPKDWIYPQLPDGSRLTTMSFTREFGNTYYHLIQEGLITGSENDVLNKLAPSVQSLNEVMRNEDYFGNQIYDMTDPFWKQFEEGMGHMSIGSMAPISVEQIMENQGEDPSKMWLGFSGFGPAPKYIDRPITESRILRFHKELYGDAPGSRGAYYNEEASGELRDAKAAYKKWLKSGDANDRYAFDAAWEAYKEKNPGRVKKGTLKGYEKGWRGPNYANEFRELDSKTQAYILSQATPEERAEYLHYAHKDVQAQFQQ